MNRDKVDKTTIELNEWGIPDWRNKEAYGNVEAWSANRWRWEFMRRRDDLRKIFDDRAEAEYRSNQFQLNDPKICVDVFKGKPSDPGFTVSFRESRELFGYLCIPNPRIGAQPEGVIKPMTGYWAYQNVIEGAKRDSEENRGWQVKSKLAMAGVLLTAEQQRYLDFSLLEAFPVMLGPDEVAIKFDLSKPLTPQIKEAAEVLRRNQKRIHGKRLTASKQYKDKWLSYLRVLDARAVSVSYKKITDTLYADGSIAAREGPDGIMRAPPPQAARDLIENAEDLRNKL